MMIPAPASLLPPHLPLSVLLLPTRKKRLGIVIVIA
jgi:hypothetical protein